jgi:hypothetical protein
MALLGPKPAALLTEYCYTINSFVLRQFHQLIYLTFLAEVTCTKAELPVWSSKVSYRCLIKLHRPPIITKPIKRKFLITVTLRRSRKISTLPLLPEQMWRLSLLSTSGLHSSLIFGANGFKHGNRKSIVARLCV